MFVWGAPGSGVERLAEVFATYAEPFRSDRSARRRLVYGLQDYAMPEALSRGARPG